MMIAVPLLAVSSELRRPNRPRVGMRYLTTVVPPFVLEGGEHGGVERRGGEKRVQQEGRAEQSSPYTR